MARRTWFVLCAEPLFWEGLPQGHHAVSEKHQEYEYYGLMAETWDHLRGDPSGRHDRDFYWAAIQRFGEPVLEVGCGTGRLLLDFLAEGVAMEGLDVSPEMLRLCADKAQRRGLTPCLHPVAIEAMALPRRYRTIIASSSVLQLITGKRAVRYAMARLYDHLVPGGALIAPFMTLWQAGMPVVREWENAHLRETDGALLQRMGRVWYDPNDGCEHTEDLYQVIVDGLVVAAEHHRRSPASRSYTQVEARQLFARAGFSDVEVWRGFTQSDASCDDLLFTQIGIR
jgi:ubiquinone/menaquinone biosynthesis C-methylase UbiE